jgi:hypothetical protein
MTKWIAAAMLAFTLTFAGPAAINPAAAAPSKVAAQKPQTWRATDLSARRRYRHHPLFADRAYAGPYFPSYYDRPYYYAPAPFVSLNFGYPILPPPWWW